MNIKKRGLGRGLEALLVNVSNKEENLTTDIRQNADNQSSIEINDELRTVKDELSIPDTGENDSIKKIIKHNANLTHGENLWNGDRLSEIQKSPSIINEMSKLSEITLIESIQKERTNLLYEVEDLKKLIHELKTIIRHL